MSAREALAPNAAGRGILPDGLVTVVSVQWFGPEALELTDKTAIGKVANELLYRHDESRIEVVEEGRPWSFDGDASRFRLVSETHRIRLAHLFDPVLAIHTPMVDPLPHQITAVYESMLTRQPLRFLLADDPGADKPIMAGLLIDVKPRKTLIQAALPSRSHHRSVDVRDVDPTRIPEHAPPVVGASAGRRGPDIGVISMNDGFAGVPGQAGPPS